MKKLLAIALLSMFATACGSDVDKLTKLKDEACACKDKACADAVNKKMDDTMSGMKEPSADDAKKLMDVMGQAAVCLAKAGATAGGK
jgi:ethanolamine ammonia-lyase small subunit